MEPVKPLERLTVAFVSGKGGVGKTMLAANFAWVCSKAAKTLLVDVDFQNQGATGLFAPHVRYPECNALDAIERPEDEQAKTPVVVAEQMSFLPSVAWEKVTSQDQISRCVNAGDFRKTLACFVEKIQEEHGFAIVVLDCHGGVDAVSLAAFQTCEHVLMVTEADSVTFNGTLELLNYYRAKSEADANINPPADALANRSKVKFIVNRLPSKYRWKDLDRIYQGLMKKGLGMLSSDRSVFCYIPIEESLADSFGEYPFYAKLAPNSIFTKKICFIVYSLIAGRFPLSKHYKPLEKFAKPSYSERVQRVVISYEQKNTQYILKFFAWFSTALAILLVVVTVAVTISGLTAETKGHSAKSVVQEVATGHVLVMLYSFLAAFTALPLFWYPLRAIFGLMFLYRDKHRFQKALFRAVSSKLSLWQRLSLAKLLLLRIGTAIIPVFTVVWVVSIIILVIATLKG